MSSLTEDTLIVKAFQALCWSRAYRWRELLEWEWIDEAVDPLQEWADQHGIDPDTAQDIIASENWGDRNG